MRTIQCFECGRDVPENKSESRHVKTRSYGCLPVYERHTVCFRCADRLDDEAAASSPWPKIFSIGKGVLAVYVASLVAIILMFIVAMVFMGSLFMSAVTG